MNTHLFNLLYRLRLWLFGFSFSTIFLPSSFFNFLSVFYVHQSDTKSMKCKFKSKTQIDEMQIQKQNANKFLWKPKPMNWTNWTISYHLYKINFGIFAHKMRTEIFFFFCTIACTKIDALFSCHRSIHLTKAFGSSKSNFPNNIKHNEYFRTYALFSDVSSTWCSNIVSACQCI